MPELTLTYRDVDTTLDRLKSLADEHGVTPEMLAKRMIDEGLGDYGLNELSEQEREASSTLEDLFIKTGLENN